MRESEMPLYNARNSRQPRRPLGLREIRAGPMSAAELAPRRAAARPGARRVPNRHSASARSTWARRERQTAAVNNRVLIGDDGRRSHCTS